MEKVKTEEQIQRDKEAVQRMIGAKSAMEAAQRRIEALEATLRHVDKRLNELSDVFGNGNFVKTYNYKISNHEIVEGKKFILSITNTIKSVM